MASFHHRITRGLKGSAAQHAAYIARHGWHAHRGDLIAAGNGNFPEWANGQPAVYWRAADKYERMNGAAYREHELALPSELSNEQLIELAEDIVDSIIGGKTYQYAIHCPTASVGGVPNPHLHLMYSDRVPDGVARSAERTFARYNRMEPEKGGARKDSGGKTRLELRNEVIATRKKIADAQNRALEKHGFKTKVDHRTLCEQGIQRAPERHLGRARVKRLSPEEKAMLAASRASSSSAASEQKV